jgi:hypothetical protein
MRTSTAAATVGIEDFAASERRVAFNEGGIFRRCKALDV